MLPRKPRKCQPSKPVAPVMPTVFFCVDVSMDPKVDTLLGSILFICPFHRGSSICPDHATTPATYLGFHWPQFGLEHMKFHVGSGAHHRAKENVFT